MSDAVPDHHLNFCKPYLKLITDRSPGVYPPEKDKAGLRAIRKG